MPAIGAEMTCVSSESSNTAPNPIVDASDHRMTFGYVGGCIPLLRFAAHSSSVLNALLYHCSFSVGLVRGFLATSRAVSMIVRKHAIGF